MSGTTSPIYNHSFLSETLCLTQEFLSDIVASINDLGEFSHEKELFWNQHITKLSLDISQFVELTTLLSKTAMARKNQSIPEIKAEATLAVIVGSLISLAFGAYLSQLRGRHYAKQHKTEVQ